MYINWAHYYVPKFDGFLSFLVNPVFIWICAKECNAHLGTYRYLLCYFSVINMFCSTCDILVPMVLHDFGHAFSVFVADGIFSTNSRFNNFIIEFRCSCISATYAILHSHFVYRYLVFCHNNLIKNYFLPYGLLLSTLYIFMHMGYWLLVCLFLIDADVERKKYMRASYAETYGTDVMEMNMLVALYSEGSSYVTKKSWIGIIAISVLSITSIVLLFFVRQMIMRSIKIDGIAMSPTTIRLQRQLIRALTAQAIIPTVVSFSPSIFAWYQPVFEVNLGKWLEDLAVIAISIFPYLDPLAIIYFVPSFHPHWMKRLTGRKYTTNQVAVSKTVSINVTA